MLTLAHITHAYGDTTAIHDCSLTLSAAERIAIIGPSGCGKSTLLRIIAGLEPKHQGRITWQQHDITQLPAHQRHIGLMFQDHALFPHLTVAQNIGYGLTHQTAPMRQQRVDELLQLIGLSALAHRFPDQLSGGERQRVALARSLAPKPRIMLFDEPFASLDRTLRDYLLGEVRSWLAREQIAALYVTHDANEACAFADQIIVMRAGHIVAQGTPAALYRHPEQPFVARLLGMPGIITYQRTTHGIQTAFGDLLLEAPHSSGTLLIRPEAGILAAHGEPHSYLHATVVASHFRPPWQRLTLQSARDSTEQFVYDGMETTSATIGDARTVAIAHAACTFLTPETSHGDDRNPR